PSPPLLAARALLGEIRRRERAALAHLRMHGLHVLLVLAREKAGTAPPASARPRAPSTRTARAVRTPSCRAGRPDTAPAARTPGSSARARARSRNPSGRRSRG